MSNDITTEAVRLALGIREAQARSASVNIANAGIEGARAQRVDFAAMQTLLSEAAQGGDATLAARLSAAADGVRAMPAQAGADPIQADEQVADMVTAGMNYQALGEALSRHFGLLRLSIAGRS
ncbi:hypothetical protein A7A76_04820 [Lysobacter enzymogenes]|uniref:hypothetical protein n=1 Tax=Lysobacter enzymogenes TaxID=69 RepID=UPI0019D000B1|nr:hypothetical protein [Lysobacter enzymogenes]MBN7138429.1 hypothetical protein [Lysobacter enzymogenes]